MATNRLTPSKAQQLSHDIHFRHSLKKLYICNSYMMHNKFDGKKRESLTTPLTDKS